MLPVYYSDVFLEHKTGAFHPERPARLEAIVNALRTAPFAAQLEWRIPEAAAQADLGRVHPAEYIQQVVDLCARGGGHLDGDTVASTQTYEAACLAVGAWLEGAKAVLGSDQPALVLCRPPGHHAEPAQGMGFCIFANAAIAALWALDQPGIERVAVFDWDVHHGNGSQDILRHHPRAAYVSTHQHPLYPGTGWRPEEAAPTVLNVPLAAGSGWPEYEQAMQTQVLPFLQTFQPDLLLVSAGFDCAKGDPLAGMLLVPEDFGRLAQMCLQLSPRCLFGLEGGYDLNNLANGWVKVAQACLA